MPVGQYRMITRRTGINQMTDVALEKHIVGSSTPAFAALAEFRSSARELTETLRGFAKAGVQGECGELGSSPYLS